MDRQAIIAELKGAIGGYLKSQSLELVDLIYRYEGTGFILRILVDKPEGSISLDECAGLNSDISKILDNMDLVKDKYTLEVSSPGLDRPLTTKSDFLRCINRKVKVFLRQTINGKMEVEGIITKVEDQAVYIEADGNMVIPLSKISRAKQVVL